MVGGREELVEAERSGEVDWMMGCERLRSSSLRPSCSLSVNDLRFKPHDDILPSGPGEWIEGLRKERHALGERVG